MNKVIFDNRWPFDMLTVTESGEIVRRTHFDSVSSRDQTPEEVLCRTKTNQDQYKNEIISAAAPDMFDLLVSTTSFLQEICSDPDLERKARATGLYQKSKALIEGLKASLAQLENRDFLEP